MMIPSRAAQQWIPTGIGDILNPAAGTSLNCGLLAGGIFNSACWCAQFPSLCLGSNATAQDVANASAAANNPAVYPAVVAPYPGVILNATSTSTAPAGTTQADFDAAYYAALQAGQATADAQNQAIMDQAAANIAAAGQQQNALSGTPTWVWIAIAGAFAFVAFKK